MAPVKGDFSQGKVSTIILRLGLPMMLAELVNVLYNIVDRMYIGHMADGGTLALTGIGICFPLITLISAFTSLFSTGGATLSTIARGEGNLAKARSILETSFTMMLAVGAFLTVSLYFAAPAVLGLLGGDEETLPAALGYFRIYVLGTIPVMISLGMNPFINAQGFAKTGMLTVVIGAALNIVLDPIFIFALNMGIEGAALATILSQAGSALWVVLFLRGKKAILPLQHLRIDVQQLGGIMKLGVTGFAFKGTNSVTQAVVNVMLKSWGGAESTLFVGAMSLINSLREIMSLPNSGITSGGQSVISFNYGAKKYRRVSHSIRFVFLAGLASNLLIWALIMLFPATLFRIFSGDEQLIALTVRCARIYFGAFPFMALQMAGQNTFVAMNYPKYALCFSLLRKIGLITPLTLLLPGWGLGAYGVFWAEFISQLVGASACFITMYLVIWRKMIRKGKEENE